jgi:hypothetical protein
VLGAGLVLHLAPALAQHCAGLVKSRINTGTGLAFCIMFGTDVALH